MGPWHGHTFGKCFFSGAKRIGGRELEYQIDWCYKRRDGKGRTKKLKQIAIILPIKEGISRDHKILERQRWILLWNICWICGGANVNWVKVEGTMHASLQQRKHNLTRPSKLSGFCINHFSRDDKKEIILILVNPFLFKTIEIHVSTSLCYTSLFSICWNNNHHK